MANIALSAFVLLIDVLGSAPLRKSLYDPSKPPVFFQFMADGFKIRIINILREAYYLGKNSTRWLIQSCRSIYPIVPPTLGKCAVTLV